MRIERRCAAGASAAARWQVAGGLRGGSTAGGSNGEVGRSRAGLATSVGLASVTAGAGVERTAGGSLGLSVGLGRDRCRLLNVAASCGRQVRLDCVVLGWLGLSERLDRLSDGTRLGSVG